MLEVLCVTRASPIRVLATSIALVGVMSVGLAVASDTGPGPMLIDFRQDPSTDGGVLVCELPYPNRDEDIALAAEYLRAGCSSQANAGPFVRFLDSNTEYDVNYGGVASDVERRVLRMEIRFAPSQSERDL